MCWVEGGIRLKKNKSWSTLYRIKRKKGPLSVHSLTSSPAAMKGKRLNPSPSPEGTVVHDLLTEILSRLPVKSLLQLRCVSKPWHSLIGDKINRKKLPPAMAGLFNKFPNMEFTGLKSRTYVDPSSFDAAVSFVPSPSPSDGRRHIFACTNGLLILSDFVRKSPNMYICNPATQMWAQIPKPSPGLLNLALAFDPASRNSSRPHYKYKIFCSLLTPREDEELYLVFSSETGEWRKFQHDGPASDRDMLFLSSADSDSVFLNGVIYAANVKHDFVLAIDLERNLCKRIQLAEVVSRVPYSSWRYLSIGCSRGLLHIAVVGEAEDQLFVFVLEEGDGDGVFVLKHEIRGLQAAVGTKFAAAAAAGGGGFHSEVDFLRDMRVIAFHQFLELIFLRLGPLIISYHLVSGELEEIDHVQETRERLYTWFPYTPCFLEDLDFLKY